MANHIKYEKGTSLIEVMVSVLILALALLGMAGLATSAIKYSKMASFQTAASRMVDDYAERMRSNIKGVKANLYGTTERYAGRSSAQIVPLCNNPSVCTFEERAAIDVVEWSNRLIQELPAGGAVVRQSNINSSAYDVWIFWIDPELDFGSGSIGLLNNCPAQLFDIPQGNPIPNCIYQKVII